MNKTVFHFIKKLAVEYFQNITEFNPITFFDIIVNDLKRMFEEKCTMICNMVEIIELAQIGNKLDKVLNNAINKKLYGRAAVNSIIFDENLIHACKKEID